MLFRSAIAEGVKPLINYTAERITKLPPIKVYEPEAPEIQEIVTDNRAFTIHRENDKFVIDAEWLMDILNNVDPDDYESLQYFQRVLQSSGIIDELERQGVQEGDTVSVFDIEFDYIR